MLSRRHDLRVKGCGTGMGIAAAIAAALRVVLRDTDGETSWRRREAVAVGLLVDA
jgi:predicted RNA methylase